MKEMKFGEETIKILAVTGYDDGYYWDYNATIEFRGEIYHLLDVGSGSGYISCFRGVKKGDFDRLYGEEQVDLWDFDDDMESVENVISSLMSAFIEYGAKESLEFDEDDWYEPTIILDGVELEK